MTDAQAAALKWLTDRGGDGIFDRTGVLLAAGERAPHERKTWNQLGTMGLVEFYRPKPRGAQRLRLTRSRSESNTVKPEAGCGDSST